MINDNGYTILDQCTFTMNEAGNGASVLQLINSNRKSSMWESEISENMPPALVAAKTQLVIGRNSKI